MGEVGRQGLAEEEAAGGQLCIVCIGNGAEAAQEGGYGGWAPSEQKLLLRCTPGQPARGGWLGPAHTCAEAAAAAVAAKEAPPASTNDWWRYVSRAEPRGKAAHCCAAAPSEAPGCSSASSSAPAAPWPGRHQQRPASDLSWVCSLQEERRTQVGCSVGFNYWRSESLGQSRSALRFEGDGAAPRHACPNQTILHCTLQPAGEAG